VAVIPPTLGALELLDEIRYLAKMVSGCRDAGSLDGSFALRIRFSAAFCSRSSWFTEPVTYASSRRTHFLFLMPTVHLTLLRAV